MDARRALLGAWALCVLLVVAGAAGGAGSPKALTEAEIAAAKGAPIPDKADMEPGELLVRFKPGRATAALGQLEQVANLHIRSTRQFRLIDWYLVQVDSSLSLPEIVAEYRKHADVLFAEPNYRVKALTQKFPNDPYFSKLWGLHNTGQSGGKPDADIDAPEAWATVTNSSVVVAVTDTGVDYSHPDLAPNMWKNPGEIPGNGKDDDGNGYVDDVYGYDFASGHGDPMDGHGHGTHVSGTIGAMGNNGVCVVGVCWRVKIMAAQFLSSSGSGTNAAAIQAIEYATLMGAKVINASWGGGGYSQALKEAISAAGAKGILFVAAAGNSGSNNDISPHYPSSYDCPNIIALAATTRTDDLASFSNYGAKSVDLGAPGKDIVSTVPGNSYATYSGTSMATPHVSGACALVWAAGGYGLTHLQVKDAILKGTDPIPALAGKCVTGGRLNLKKSVDLVAIGRGIAVQAPNGGEGYERGATVAITWSTFGPAWQPSDKVKVEYSANGGTNWAPIAGAGSLDYSKGSYPWVTTGLTAGTQYRVRVTFLGDAKVNDMSDGNFAVTGPLDRFEFAMASPQRNNSPVSGACTVTAKDASGSTINSFGSSNTAGRFPVTLTAPGVSIGGLGGSGNALTADKFVNGTANLSALGMTLSVPSTPATVQFTAKSANGKTGLSGSVLIGPEFLTQLFDSESFDLSNRTLTFVPNGSSQYYAPYCNPITKLPTDPSGGTPLAFTSLDDGYATVTLGGGAKVSLFGTAYSTFYVGTNGYITFTAGDSDYTESLSDHFRLPRISALFDDLYPSSGQVTLKQLPDRVAVTYQNVRQYGSSDSSTFQIEMFFSGKIVISYLAVAATDGLAGLSRGTGIPTNFVESDLSAYPPYASTGSLKVTLGPSQAVSAGAQWRVDGGAWQKSGATVGGLPVGGRQVEYKAATGWAAPPTETVQISSGKTTSITRTYTTQPTSSAVYVKTDAATQGNWKGTYGTEGHRVVQDSAKYPSYAKVAEPAYPWLWAASPADTRALLRDVSGRVAACWFAPSSSMSFDVNLTDGKVHRVALYFLDWDTFERAVTVEFRDAGSNALLDTRSVTAFHGGKYLVWDVRGHVRIVITRTAGANPVVSGLFFGVGTPASAVFVKTDTATQGDWKGTYGTEGRRVVQDTTKYPSYAKVAEPAVQWLWAPASTEKRALRRDVSGRVAACWFAVGKNSSMTFDMDLTDGKVHRVALYFLDWDTFERAATVEFRDAASNALLDTRSVTAFHDGKYLVWDVRGHVRIVITRTAGANPVVSGLFFGATTPASLAGSSPGSYGLSELDQTAPADDDPSILLLPNRGPAPLDIQTMALGIEPGTPCTWDFGDGIAPDQGLGGENAVHTYLSPGVYTVTLRAGGKTARATVVVQAPPGQ